MKPIATSLLLASLTLGAAPLPALAQESEGSRKEEGLSLMEQGLSMLFEELLKDMEPALRELEGLQQDMGPALEELLGRIGELSQYHAPEVLENGDILIRRKTPEELRREEEARPLEDGEVEI
ncbi:hypothetical protein PSA7680_01938 [Pseudoruegeria aquimaris]|uniref:AAA+ family ATPase n=1 Tax=Pseudoruegeria aquimaris TaxID=393663 RepID=A0A1Y5SF43_9RHOB|nr:hypothetical protein [Pseudoruegeria aquimaris]SLN39357.1 hypothetical protein PSA7680_01938 [Pseudoruegeria aquimaris]